MQAKYDANRAKKKSALVPSSEVMSTELREVTADNGDLTRKNLHHPLYNANLLEAPPFHPAYVFNHIKSARQGPYPRTPNSITEVPYHNMSHTGTQNGYVNSGISANITNGHTGQTRISNGRVESV